METTIAYQEAHPTPIAPIAARLETKGTGWEYSPAITEQVKAFNRKGHKATLLTVDLDGTQSCRLYNTCIASRDPAGRTIRLGTGGFNTATTIRRMNQLLEHWGVDVRVCRADFKARDVMVLANAFGRGHWSEAIIGVDA
jgi:hypothetical protein